MSDKYLASLEEKRNEAWHRAKQIMDLAATEGRDITPEEKVSLEQTDAAIDGYAAEEKRIRDTVAKMAAADNLRGDVEKAVAETRSESLSPDPKSDIALFIAMIDGAQKGVYGEARAYDSHYSRRALSGNVGTAIPTTFADFVAVYQRTASPMFEVSKTINTNTGAPIVIPRLTADTVAGGTVTAEAGGITEGDPTISQVTLTAFKYAYTTLYSWELGNDEVIGLEELLAEAIGRPIGINLGSYFTLGTGTTQPQGFLGVATNGGTAGGTALNQATDKYFAASDLVDVFYALPAPYRKNSSWMTPSSGIARMRKFRDSTGQFIWQPGNIAQGQPDTFLGIPVYENPAMAAVGSATTSIAVGDFSKYIIRNAGPMRVDISDQYKFATDQLALRSIIRADGNLPDVKAINFLVSQAI